MKHKPTAVYRCDLLKHSMNAGKEARVRALLTRWRQVAVLMGREQWRLFYQTGQINPRHAGDTAVGMLGTCHRQMIRHQVAGVLAGWISNRQNDYRDRVHRSTLAPELKHQLHVINRMKAWHRPGPLVMRDGTEIPATVRRLARRIFASVCRRHRRPDLSKINMVVDQRMIALSPAKQASAFPLWARLSTLEKGQPIWVPLQTHAYFNCRQGTRALTLQINDTDAGLRFGVLTDVSEAMAASQASYIPRCDSIALDLGLRTLFATDRGDLLGCDWMDHLQRIDRRITRLAAHRQAIGLKKVRSPRYRRQVQQLRGFISTEVGRILSRMVEVHAPAAIVVEHLRFQSTELSRRMNRLLSWFGKAAIEQKLRSLSEVHGITIDTVHVAYSSQECGACGYVDQKNRPRQAAFACRWCHSTGHADVNAARVLRRRRSVPVLSHPERHRRAVLEVLVSRHTQRFARLRAGPADPRLSNPYFRDWAEAVTSIAGGG